MTEAAELDGDVYAAERQKWNALAERDLDTIRPIKPGDNFHRFARRSRTMVGMSEFLGDLEGKQVLEYGCGLGQISVLLALSGATVYSFDLSDVSVQVTRKRAQMSGVGDAVTVTVAVGENLPYADEAFDIVVGKAILHHLNVALAASHLYRVLKKGGKASFAEPMGMNPLLRFTRNHLPYPHKNPRGADHPLNYEEINQWGAAFPQFTYRELQLFSMLERGLGFKWRLPLLRRLDDALLQKLPFLRRYCRYVVLYMTK